MLFLVGGTSRSGKTLIARRLLAGKQIPYLSLDWLMMGFNDGIPEYGIHRSIRAVFVGYADIDTAAKVELVKEHGTGENDWLTRQSDEYFRDHIGNMIAFSKKIKAGCEKHGLPYFDTSNGFPAAIEAATDFLIGNTN